MNTTDGRHYKKDVKEYLRKEAHRRVDAGESVTKVMRELGLSRAAYYKQRLRKSENGINPLDSRKGTGRPPELSDKQLNQIRTWINGKDPRQYGFDFGLWTRAIICELVQRHFGIEISLITAGRWLSKLGITPQKPLRRSYERDESEIKKWKDEEFKKIRARCKRRKAKIFFMDEAGIRSDDLLGRSWGIKGKTPIVKTSGQRQQVNAISAVARDGSFWYEVYTGRFNSDRMVEMLTRFIKGRGKICLIVDGHPAHKSNMIKNFIKQCAGKLEIYFLPGYAPELNPDEFVWHEIKQNGTSKRPLKMNESLKDRVESDLAELKGDRIKLRNFFESKHVGSIMY